MTDHAMAVAVPDQRLMQAGRQTARRELGEGPREGRFARDSAAPFPTAHPAQAGIAGQPVEQRAGGRQSENRLGDERPGDRPPIIAWPPAAAGITAHVRLQADQVEDADELLVLVGQRPQLLAEPADPRQQR
jgi:hypothetical protein